MKGRGCGFRSETDTEVIVYLLAERAAAGEGLREALVGTLKRLEGSFALAAMSADEPGTRELLSLPSPRAGRRRTL